MDEAPAPNSKGPNARRAWILWGITTAALLLLAARAALAVHSASLHFVRLNMITLPLVTPWAQFVGRYLWLGAIVLSIWGVREARRQDRLRILEWSLGSALIVLGLYVFVEFALQLPLVRIQEALSR